MPLSKVWQHQRNSSSLTKVYHQTTLKKHMENQIITFISCVICLKLNLFQLLTCFSSLPLFRFFSVSNKFTSYRKHFRSDNVTSPKVPEFSNDGTKNTPCDKMKTKKSVSISRILFFFSERQRQYKQNLVFSLVGLLSIL